jgi:hypothetical protein
MSVTARAGRKHWQRELKNPISLKLNKCEKNCNTGCSCCSVEFYYTQNILILSTNSDPETTTMMTRETKKGREETDTLCPKAGVNYMKTLMMLT